MFFPLSFFFLFAVHYSPGVEWWPQQHDSIGRRGSPAGWEVGCAAAPTSPHLGPAEGAKQSWFAWCETCILGLLKRLLGTLFARLCVRANPGYVLYAPAASSTAPLHWVKEEDLGAEDRKGCLAVLTVSFSFCDLVQAQTRSWWDCSHCQGSQRYFHRSVSAAAEDPGWGKPNSTWYWWAQPEVSQEQKTEFISWQYLKLDGFLAFCAFGSLCVVASLLSVSSIQQKEMIE